MATKNTTLWFHLRELLSHHIHARRLTQTEVAKLSGCPQPRISQILSSSVKIGSSDSLLHILESTGCEISFTKASTEESNLLTMEVSGR